LTGFIQHKRNCVLSKTEINKIRNLYISGMLFTEIVRRGYSEKLVKFYIKDIKRKHNASECLKKSYLIGTRQKVISSCFKKQQCTQCKRFFNSGNFKKHKCFSEQQINEIIKMYSSGMSTYELIRAGYHKSLITVALKDKHRSLSEAIKLVHKQNPEVFKHSTATKDKIRETRFEYLKKRTGKTAWEKRNKQIPSSLEQWFIDKIVLKFNLNEKYDIVSEYAEFPYFIDFAFVNIKLAVELDGPAHFSHGNVRFEHDLKKDRHLLSKGWKVVRIAYNEINQERINSFLTLLNNLSEYRYVPKVLENHIFKNKTLRINRDNSKRLELQRKSKIRLLLRLLKQLEKIKIVENSSIDFSKIGWVNEVSKLLKIKTQKVNKWMKTYMYNFYKTKCYKKLI
jgi:very-short-patch-repair endonuclease